MLTSVTPSLTLFALLIALPLAFPVLELARHPSGLAALLEARRVASLLGNTLGLAIGTVALAVPAGTAAAVLLERGRVPGRSLLRGLVLLGAVIPLYVYAAAWQAVFGLIVTPDVGGWQPWRTGLVPAIWVHAVAGVPWVAAFVMLAVVTADPQLEDDARLTGGAGAVWWGVLWPRVRFAALAGAWWTFVQEFTEAAVTDLFMVRTFAEEVYFQLVGNPAGVAAAVAVTVPAWVFSVVLAAVALSRGAATQAAAGVPRPAFGPAWVAIAVWAGVVGLVAVPCGALALRTGELGQFTRVVRVHGPTLAVDLFWAAVAGLAAAGFALAACWRARDSRVWAAFLLALTAVACVTPAPLVGLGLKSLIGLLVSAEDAVLGTDAAFPPVRSLLYDQPSPVPGVWAAAVRFFPIAVAVLWVAVRGVQRELIDAAALDGGRRAVWRAAVWPGVRRAFVAAAAAVTLLSLGEVVATKLVQPPGRRSFSGDVFDAMHYGADATVAAMCLLQVTATAVLVACIAHGRRR